MNPTTLREAARLTLKGYLHPMSHVGMGIKDQYDFLNLLDAIEGSLIYSDHQPARFKKWDSLEHRVIALCMAASIVEYKDTLTECDMGDSYE